MDREYFKMEICEPWAKLVLLGIKTLELQVNDPMIWGRVRVNDVININDCRSYLVNAVREYADFESAVIGEGVRNLLPGKKTMNDAKAVYFGADIQLIDARKREFQEDGAVVFELEAYYETTQQDCLHVDSDGRTLINYIEEGNIISRKCLWCHQDFSVK